MCILQCQLVFELTWIRSSDTFGLYIVKLLHKANKQTDESTWIDFFCRHRRKTTADALNYHCDVVLISIEIKQSNNLDDDVRANECTSASSLCFHVQSIRIMTKYSIIPDIFLLSFKNENSTNLRISNRTEKNIQITHACIGNLSEKKNLKWYVVSMFNKAASK